MMKRRLSVTILAWVFVVVGSIGVAAGLVQFLTVMTHGSLSSNRHYITEAGFTLLSGLIAATGGAGLLRGFGWARWVCIIWMALHVLVSMLHTPIEVMFHVVMLAGMIYILFRKTRS